MTGPLTLRTADLYDQGLAPEQIAEALETSRGCVYSRLHDAGRYKFRWTSPVGRGRIMDLKLRGWTDSRIAEETGCDRSTITRIVVANEIGGDHWREARRVVVPALRTRGRTTREICEVVPCGVRAVEAALSPDDDEGREECRQILAENLRRMRKEKKN